MGKGGTGMKYEEKKMKEEFQGSNDNRNCDWMSDEGLKTLGACLKRLSSLQSIHLDFQK